MSRAELRIAKLLDFVKRNISMQNINQEDEESYRSIFATLVFKAYVFVVLKIVATVLALAYSGWKTKEFYRSQGIADVKQ